MARAIAAKIDATASHAALERARKTNRRWRELSNSPLHDKWQEILGKDWKDIRAILLKESEESAQLRQNNPFCGIISPRERWEIYRKFRDHES